MDFFWGTSMPGRSLEFRLALLIFVMVWLSAGSVSAGGKGAIDRRPIDGSATIPSQWIQGDPINVAALGGKVTIVAVINHDAGSMDGEIREIERLMKVHRGKPLAAFIIVYGMPEQEAKLRLRKLRTAVPAVLDQPGHFAQRIAGGKLEAKVVVYQPRGWRDEPEHLTVSVNRSIGQAQWRIAPEGLPVEIVPAWQAFEDGNFAKALEMLGRLSQKQDKDLQEPINQIKGEIVKCGEAELGNVDQLEGQKRVWQAYQAYARIASEYKGTSVEQQAEAARQRLESDEMVRRELLAQRKLDRITRVMSSRILRVRRAAYKALDELTLQEAGTDAAVAAKLMLDWYREF